MELHGKVIFSFPQPPKCFQHLSQFYIHFYQLLLTQNFCFHGHRKEKEQYISADKSGSFKKSLCHVCSQPAAMRS